MNPSGLLFIILATIQWYQTKGKLQNIQRTRPGRMRAYRIRLTDDSTTETGEEQQQPEEPTSATASFPHMEIATPSCAGRDFNITVTGKRCASKVVKSKFCYGLCSSFYVPGRVGGASKMMECCLPTETVVETVELECMRKGNKGMRIKKVEVERVLECGCQRAN